MLELLRTVRFAVNDPPPSAPPGAAPDWGAPSNTFAGYPTMRGVGRHYELEVRCRGTPDPATGYFLNIKEIDQAARRTIIPAIERACRERPWDEPATILRDALPDLARAVASPGAPAATGPNRTSRLAAVRWRLSPYYSVEVNTAAPNTALLRQQFEFAASHRLHVPGLGDERNRELFGKCNHPSGHGHNYRVEPCVEVPVGAAPVFTLADLERLTHETIIKKFDHTHLNTDTPEFAPPSPNSPGGLNPSVENIAKVCYELLEPAVRGANPAAKLRSVTVWETDKTSCTYPA